MLKRLYISNFALINEMDVSFPGKLTVVTGETGAGKSIFLEALGLAIGQRADMGAVKNKSKKCVVEAEFDVKNLDLKDVLAESDLEIENTLVLRREINAEGKSRSFLNDSLVGLATLKKIAEKLVDVHSQHQTLLLNQSNFQMELIDAFAGSTKRSQEFKSEFSKLMSTAKLLNALMEKEGQAKKELDYYQFLFSELEEAGLKSGNLKLLEEQSASLENAEFIKAALLMAGNVLQEGEVNPLNSLAVIKQKLGGITKYNRRYEQFYERVNSVYIELKELASELVISGDQLHVDLSALEEVNGKLDKLNRLLNKHNVKTEEELLIIKADIENKLEQFTSLSSEIEKNRRELAQLQESCTKAAKDLSELRKAAIPCIEKKIVGMLMELSMENARFKIELSLAPELSQWGFDTVKFLFSANKGGQLQELQKVASGGELSRLMLSLKALLASKKQLPTIIFDEIDTGVSGDVADKIGSILMRMSHSLQVVTITHLPQMASKGEHHLFVYKKDDEDNTVSYIKTLDEKERVTEIAKMLSTNSPTPSALKNAKELLSLNNV